MAFLTHRPCPALAPFVHSIWYFEGTFAHARERILPSGRMQLLVNLHEDELRTYHGDRAVVARTGGAALSGAWGAPFVIDTAEQRAVAGVTFFPGGAFPFFPAPADATADNHVALEALWGRQSALLRERLLEARTPDAIVRTLEHVLLAQAGRPLAPDPAVTFAIRALEGGQPVAGVTEALGMTPGRFIRRFTERVGLTPKRFARVRRFQRVLEGMGLDRAVALVEVALDCGYHDQAHFNHDFRAFAGVNPTGYQARAAAPNHIPLAG